MHPILLKFGPLTLYSYGLMLALGFLLALFVAERRARAAGLDAAVIQNLAFTALVAGLVGGRVAYVLLNLQVFLENPMEILRLDHGGLVFYGGLIAGMAAGVCFIRAKKLPVLLTLDVMIPPLVLAHAVGRIGCFLNGCCYGKPTALPWGVVFPGDTVIRHPVQLYETGALLVICCLLKRIEKAGFPAGGVLLSYGLLYGCWRFVIEFFRADNPGIAFGLTVFQWLSLLLIAVSILAPVLKRMVSRPSKDRHSG